jgi:thioredoxin 1
MTDIILKDENFEEEVLQSKIPVVADFWAPWCGPCRVVSPIIEELAKEYEGKVKIGKLNVDENPQNASKYGVMSIPSVLFFKDGKPVKTMVGAQNKENYKEAIEQMLGSA